MSDYLLLEALVVLDTNLPTYKNEVGATAEDFTEVSQNRANLAQALTNVSIIEADKQTSTAIKNALAYGDATETVGVYPAFAIQALPFPAAFNGIETQYREMKARFKSAKSYTKEIGIALGFESVSSGAVNLNDLIAAAKLLNLGEYNVKGEFKKQGMKGMAFQWRIKGTEKWSSAINALESPFVFSIPPPATEGASVEIELRCRLLKGNEQVGQWSPIYSLTVTA